MLSTAELSGSPRAPSYGTVVDMALIDSDTVQTYVTQLHRHAEELRQQQRHVSTCAALASWQGAAGDQFRAAADCLQSRLAADATQVYVCAQALTTHLGMAIEQRDALAAHLRQLENMAIHTAESLATDALHVLG